jgi:hypothetical protein
MQVVFYVLAVTALVVLSLIFGPLLFIWALNELFLLNIQYTFWTWLAAMVLLISLKTTIINK